MATNFSPLVGTNQPIGSNYVSSITTGGGGSMNNSNLTMAQMQNAGFSVDMINSGQYGINSAGKPYYIGGGNQGGGGAMGNTNMNMGGMTPASTPGSTVSTHGSTTTPVSGPQGPFSSLGPQLSGNASNLMTAGNTALNTGMASLGSDIYNQERQQEQNQTNVNEAQRGITMSPYGAGVANQADINFNSNWQNQQLARQQAGISAAASAMAPGTGLYNSSYGSSTQGYDTNPPSQQQSQSSGGSVSRQASAPQSQPFNMPQFDIPQPQQMPMQQLPQQQSNPYTIYPGPQTYGPQQVNNTGTTLLPYGPEQMQPPSPSDAYPQDNTLSTPYQPNYQEPQPITDDNTYTTYSGTYGDTGGGYTPLTSGPIYDTELMSSVQDGLSSLFI